MAKYLISFEKGAMDHIPQEDFPDVGKASKAVCQEAIDAGVFVFSDGLDYDGGDVQHAVVGTDGIVTDGPYPESKELIGGVLIVDVPTREAALEWAVKVAVACRCAQDVRKFINRPTPAPRERNSESGRLEHESSPHLGRDQQQQHPRRVD